MTPSANIIREADGTLLVPTNPTRSTGADHETDPHDQAATHHGSGAAAGQDNAAQTAGDAPATEAHALHPGEGGYDEALAAWDQEQDPSRPPAVSTASGRDEAMSVIHTVATTPGRAVGAAVDAVADRAATAAALRHVLVGGVHSVEGFAAEVAEATGSDVLPAFEVTQIIGDVLAVLDS